MNVLISQFFGDPYIQLSCPYGGECLHFSQVPGYTRPDLPTPFTPLELSSIILGAILLLFMVFGFIRWAAKKSDADRLQLGYLSILDVDDEQDEAERRRLMMTHHTPASLMFRDVSYIIDKKKQQAKGTWFGRNPSSDQQQADETGGHRGAIQTGDGDRLVILDGVHGTVKSGQVMAIMGGSGMYQVLRMWAASCFAYGYRRRWQDDVFGYPSPAGKIWYSFGRDSHKRQLHVRFRISVYYWICGPGRYLDGYFDGL